MPNQKEDNPRKKKVRKKNNPKFTKKKNYSSATVSKRYVSKDSDDSDKSIIHISIRLFHYLIFQNKYEVNCWGLLVTIVHLKNPN